MCTTRCRLYPRVETKGDSSGSGFVDDPEDVESCNETCVLEGEMVGEGREKGEGPEGVGAASQANSHAATPQVARHGWRAT